MKKTHWNHRKVRQCLGCRSKERVMLLVSRFLHHRQWLKLLITPYIVHLLLRGNAAVNYCWAHTIKWASEPFEVYPVSPLLLLLIHGDATRTSCYHQEQTSDHRRGLEEVVLEEVMHGPVVRNGPEGIEVDVDDKEPDYQSECSQLRLEPDGHQDHQSRAHQVLQDLQDKKTTYTHR